MGVRAALPDDAAAIGRINVDAWRRAYAGLIADEILDGMDPEASADGWRRAIERVDDERAILVFDDGGVLGYAAAGPADDGGHLYAIYVDPDMQGNGIGSALLAEAERHQGRLHSWMSLSVLRDNTPTREWYERRGWSVVDETETVEIHGITYPTTRYRKQVGSAP